MDSGSPRHTPSRSATFRFSSDDPDVYLRCTLDSESFLLEECSSPKTFDGLSDGKHTLRVWVWDYTADNEDTSPAAYEWTVDTSAPDTTVASGPPALARSDKAAFAFSSSELGSTFECPLDGSAYAPCSSPKGYAGLEDGAHRLGVRATNGAGNLDASPAQGTCTVDMAKPSGRVSVNGGAVATRGRKDTLSLRASDPAPATGVTSVRVRNAGGPGRPGDPTPRRSRSVSAASNTASLVEARLWR